MSFVLDPARPDRLTDWLHDRGQLIGDAVQRLEVAGAGNMNLVLRGVTTAGSLVVKQSRPHVRRFPQIPAPVERTEVEAAWYDAIAGHPGLAARTPTILLHDPDDHVLVMEDLGPTADLASLYAGEAIDTDLHEALLAWVSELHALRPAPTPLLRNEAMRRLNHEHVFALPFRPDNGLDLDAITPGLAAVARMVATDAPLVARIHALGARYLADGDTLLHGDLYPGSIVRIDRGLVVLDPEFGFFGEPAYDRGVWLAHLVLARQQDRQLAKALEGAPPETLGFAGVEILRRLLGVAQLPLTADLSTKEAMIRVARAWLREEE